MDTLRGEHHRLISVLRAAKTSEGATATYLGPYQFCGGKFAKFPYLHWRSQLNCKLVPGIKPGDGKLDKKLDLTPILLARPKEQPVLGTRI